MSIKLYDKVTLYGKNRNIYGYNQDGKYEILGETIDYYVADANDKKQNGTGEHWATDSRIVYKDGVAVRDERGNFVYEEIPPIIHTTDNKDFKLAINMSAGGSSQGGKLSFWMCKITKTLEDGTVIDGNIGINQEELKDLLKESTFVNGVCQEPVAFYRISGNVGICTTTGEKYKQALKDKAEDESLKKAKKTSKWELGRVYKTKTLSSIWIGDAIHPIKGKVHVLVDGRYANLKINEVCEKAWFEYVEKFPSRIPTDETVDVTGFDKAFDDRMEKELKRDISNGVYGYHFDDDLCYANGLDKDLVKTYLLYVSTYVMERRLKRYTSGEWSGRMFEEVDALCEHFNLDDKEIYNEAYNNKDTMKYKPKKEK